EGVAFHGLVLTFTDPGGAEALAHYSALINWGDGTAPTPGGVGQAGNALVVYGWHIYAVHGTFTPSVTLQDNGGAPQKVTGTAVVADVPLTATAVAVQATEWKTFTAVV